jgi:hypothetical protein
MALQTNRLLPEFRYNVESQRYVAANGRYVARETVKAAGEAIVQKSIDNISTVSQRFYDGEISHKEWDASMRQHIRTLHVAEGTLASGGPANMDAAHYGRIGPVVREQYQFLNGLGERIQSGYYGEDLKANGFLVHAQMYGEAGRGTFEYVQGVNAIEGLGHDEIANVYGGNEHHCDGEGSCKQMNDLGWIRVDSEAFRKVWKWPGSRRCVTKDHCAVKTRKAA